MRTPSAGTKPFRSLSLALCAAGGLSVLAGSAQAAADGTLGSALLAARVQTDATILAGAGATGTVKIGTGTYEVDFNRNVAGCFYNAVSFTNTVAEFVEPRGGNPNGVFLFFTSLGSTSANPAAQDSQFYLTVSCVR